MSGLPGPFVTPEPDDSESTHRDCIANLQERIKETGSCPECGGPVVDGGVWLDLSPRIEAVEQPTIASLQARVKTWTAEKGWDDDRSVGDLLMLMVSELAEAMEEYRDWHEPTEIRVHAGKPEGVPIELADTFIRILSFCGKFGIDLQYATLCKLDYNETRPHRHGGKRL